MADKYAKTAKEILDCVGEVIILSARLTAPPVYD